MRHESIFHHGCCCELYFWVKDFCELFPEFQSQICSALSVILPSQHCVIFCAIMVLVSRLYPLAHTQLNNVAWFLMF